MHALFSRPMPDWSNRASVAAFIAAGAESLRNDPEQAYATVARIWDRTRSSEPSVHQANQLGIVFARLDCTPRWHERLCELTLPTLVVHGAADPFFPVGNGEVLAAEIRHARLLALDDMGTALRTPSRTRSPPRCSPYDSSVGPPTPSGWRSGGFTRNADGPSVVDVAPASQTSQPLPVVASAEQLIVHSSR